MRAERSGPVPRVPPSKPTRPFTQVLARIAGHAATAKELQRARASHAVEAHRLVEVHKGHPLPSSALPRGVRERLAKALEPAPDPASPQPQVPPIGGPGQAAAGETGDRPQAPASRVESALQLVERIAVFLRSGRPQLELSVGGQLQAEVLLERTGPREVAVTLRGRSGPPPAQELARVRQELERRGLKLSSLAIG